MWLDAINDRHKEKIYGGNGNITDKNFPSPTDKLEPDKTYRVQILEIANEGRELQYKTCLDFMKAKNALSVGVHGLYLVFHLKRKEIPLLNWTFSLDQEDRLWKDEYSQINIPGFSPYPTERNEFLLRETKKGLHSNDFILMFFKD